MRRLIHGFTIVAMIAGIATPALLNAQPAAAASGASLSQCTNGPVGPPLSAQPCVGSNAAAVSVAIPGINGGASTSYKNWVNGNSNGSKSHWREGEFISYRTTISGLSQGQHVLVIHYDTVHSGGHALDYLGSYDGTETTASSPTSVGSTIIHANNNNPCQDLVKAGQMTLAQCNPSSLPATQKVAAPAENFGPTSSGGQQNCGGAGGTFSGSQVPGTIDLFGPSGSTMDSAAVTADNVAGGTGQCTSTVTLKFTLSQAISASQAIVIAWGGHIASQQNWGVGNSASFINGSPYHMALDTLDGASTGSQDRALANSAVFFTPSLTTSLSASTISTGDSVTDTATLSNASSSANGAITINVYSGSTSASCTGTPVASKTATPATNGNGNYTATFSGLAAGSYEFQAVFAADSSDTGATSACGTEPLTVGAPHIQITKTADAPTVNAGDPIGFTVTVTNAGTGLAHGVMVSDPLPAGSGSGVTWTIDTQSNAGLCSTSGSKPSQQLTCGPTDLAAGASFSVHVTATTSAAECTVYDNTATASSTNDGGGSSEAKITCIEIVSQITPTQTTCSTFSNGTSSTLSQVQYSVKSGKISQVNPGVFFYWVKVQATAGSNTFTVNQAISTGNFSTFFSSAAGSGVFTAGCTSVTGATVSQSGAVTTIKFTAATAGTYIIGVKYSTSGVVGVSAPSPTTVHYTFTEDSHTSTTQQGLDLVKK